jgi:protease-4
MHMDGSHPMKNKEIISLLSLTLWLYILFIAGCANVSIPLRQSTLPLKEKTLMGKGRDKILLIDISGVIIGEDKESLTGFTTAINPVARIKEELEKASRDKRVKGLILRIDSPGGTATASDIIQQEILRFKEKKKVFVSASLVQVAASGGYYIATAADKIIAHPTTVTGSIGVIAMKFNIKELMDKLGIEEESIKSGDKKDLFSPFRGATPEEKKIIQDIIDSLYQRFLQAIAEGRKELSIADITPLADGRIFTAQQALQYKLIDGIGYLDDVFEMTKSSSGVNRARLVTYHRPREYKNNIYSQATIELFNMNKAGIFGYQPVQFMYLWSP